MFIIAEVIRCQYDALQGLHSGENDIVVVLSLGKEGIVAALQLGQEGFVVRFLFIFFIAILPSAYYGYIITL